MQYYYGEKNLLRALDEAEFWKHQETEHTTVIQMVTPNLEMEFIERLKEFERVFSSTYMEIVRSIESVVRSKGMFSRSLGTEMIRLVKQSITESREFVAFLEDMIKKSLTVQNNMPAQTVIKHIIRESQYFIGIEQLIL